MTSTNYLIKVRLVFNISLFSMKFVTYFHKIQKNLVLTLLGTGLLVISSTVFTPASLAETVVVPRISFFNNAQIALLPPEGKFPEPSNYAERSVQQLVQDTQVGFDKAVFDADAIINKLPEEITSEIRANEVASDETSLKSAANSINELTEKVRNFREKFEVSGVLEDKELKDKLENLQNSLENSAKKLDILAEDTDSAKVGASNSLEKKIKREIKTVQEALQKTNEAFQAFTENAG